MTRKEKISLLWLMASMALIAGLSVELLFPRQGSLAGLAAAGISGWIYTYRIQDRRARMYRDAANRMGSLILDKSGMFRVAITNPSKCASCKRRTYCVAMTIDKVRQN